MMKEKVIKVFDTEVLQPGTFITVGLYLTGDDGQPELSETRNGIILKSYEKCITAVFYSSAYNCGYSVKDITMDGIEQGMYKILGYTKDLFGQPNTSV